MKTIEKTLYESVTAAVGPETTKQAAESLERLERSGTKPLEDLRILLPFGGGKDSAWTLAYVRLMQLNLRERLGRGFELHVLMMVHPGVPQGVFDNVVNVFKALEIANDPEVKVSVVSLHRELKELRADALDEDVRECFKEEILYSGHLSQGNGRETFCNSCNFNLMNSIARYVLNAPHQLDFVITGDSGNEYISYWKWVRKAAGKFELPAMKREHRNWGGLFSKLGELNNSYYNELFQRDSQKNTPFEFPDVLKGDFQPPDYFSVFGDTSYEYWTHTDFLTDFLGFRLRPDAFNFTESDCRNPALMSHLRGLLAEFEGRGYLAGIQEYLSFIQEMMQKKQYNQEMIDLALAPYESDEKIFQRRDEMVAYAAESFNISSLQLRAMVASPLADNCARLRDFLVWVGAAEREESLRRYFDLVMGKDPEELSITSAEYEAEVGSAYSLVDTEAFIEEYFGLQLRSLRNLLSARTVSRPVPENTKPSRLEILRQEDPHQKQTDAPAGGANALITGR